MLTDATTLEFESVFGSLYTVELWEDGDVGIIIEADADWEIPSRDIIIPANEVADFGRMLLAHAEKTA